MKKVYHRASYFLNLDSRKENISIESILILPSEQKPSKNQLYIYQIVVGDWFKNLKRSLSQSELQKIINDKVSGVAMTFGVHGQRILRAPTS